MYIAETFYSVQGEGKNIGVPSFFIRTSGCNLRCEWRDLATGELTKCDTPYTSWESDGTFKSLDELVLETKKTPAKHVVITGGEPFMQKELGKLTAALADLGYHITIETNGTIFKELPAEAYLSISPKMSNSIPIGSQYESRHRNLIKTKSVLKELIQHHDYQIKFVVTIPEDLAEITQLQNELRIPSEKIYLMPEGDKSAIIREKSKWLIELCKEYGFNFSDRLHIHIWGSNRGF